MTSTNDIDRLLGKTLELVHKYIDPRRVADARRRQADVFNWKPTDYLPLVFWGSAPELTGLPDFDWRRQFDDPRVSLYVQLKLLIATIAHGADICPAVRADTGVINCPTVLGAPYEVPAHTKPVINGNVGKAALAAFRVPDDISGLGVLPIMARHARHHLAALKRAGLAELVILHHCDLQGPFDIAAQAYGHDEIFLDLYIDGPFVHELMAKSTDIYVKMAVLCKQLAGQPLRAGHANQYWMDPGSVRVCDDSGILVSAEKYAEFLVPYIAPALAPFGGGWIHYCGGVPDGNRPEGLHLHDLYCAVPGMRGLNFTTASGLEGQIEKLMARKVAYLGGLPREKEAPLAQHFRHALELCKPHGRRGMIFEAGVRAGEEESAVALWRKLQDEMLPKA